MDRTTTRDLAVELLNSHGLTQWTFAWSQHKKTLGQCRHTTRTILLSTYYVDRNPPEMVTDTMTQARHRAITNMTKRLNEEADAWVQHEFGVDKLDDLTVRQASEFIDTLKTLSEDAKIALRFVIVTKTKEP